MKHANMHERTIGKKPEDPPPKKKRRKNNGGWVCLLAWLVSATKIIFLKGKKRETHNSKSIEKDNLLN